MFVYMIQELTIRIPFDKVEDDLFIKNIIQQKLKIDKKKEFHFLIRKKSIDARPRRPIIQLQVNVSSSPIEDPVLKIKKRQWPSVTAEKKVHIIGAGPAGYFAALQCLDLGLKPIIYDRGKDVQARRRDLKAIQQQGEVNPNSNYCFGEGGAGTYSDGKLYTRSHKRGNIQDILEILVYHGAPIDILQDAHPHIGSNKLPKIVANIRETILEKGGEIHFNTLVTDIQCSGAKINGFSLENGDFIQTDQVILATGHSARDVFEILDRQKITLHRKPFAIGVRIEHPQAMIDELRYRQNPRSEHLPAADYRLSCQIDEVGVFSFCMCPGGLIVPASTAPGELVVNGMSLSKRDSPFANSGFVTAIENEELERKGYSGVFGNLQFQKDVETKFFEAGDGTQQAPAQRVTDFVQRKASNSLKKTSYIPGIYDANLYELLPDFVYHRLSKGIIELNEKLKGFYSEEAQIVGLESRTSSPIRIPRHPESLMNEQAVGLFPCGEGAGYAGGILSACMDGQRVAKAVHQYIKA